jgi:hypothetical protein
MSKVNKSNIASLAYTPIKYAGGPNTYLYLDLTGSFYVVAVSGINPSGFSNYEFSHHHTLLIHILADHRTITKLWKHSLDLLLYCFP